MHYYFNKFVLGLKEEDFIIQKHYQDGDKFFLFLELTKREQTCPRCNNKTSYIHDYRTRTIKHGNINGYHLILKYNQRRYVCKKCRKRFIEKNSLVTKFSKISKRLNEKILKDLQRPLTFKQIAIENNVSSSTVIRRNDKHIKEKPLTFPEVISIDEFKKSNARIKQGKYALAIADPINEKIIDILPDRRKKAFDNYLNNVPKNVLAGVKIVNIDMWETNRQLVSKHFPNAKIVIDRFHYVRHVIWWLNDIRIIAMNSFKTNQDGYKLLKKYHKLILKNPTEVLKIHSYNKYFKKLMSPASIIEECLKIDEDLLKAYRVYKYFQENTSNIMESEELANDFINDFIQLLWESNLPNSKALAQTFINWRKEIINSLYLSYNDKSGKEKRYSNGFLEGTNNFIKTIRRMSYNFRCFKRFKKRIITLFNKECVLT